MPPFFLPSGLPGLIPVLQVQIHLSKLHLGSGPVNIYYTPFVLPPFIRYAKIDILGLYRPTRCLRQQGSS